MSEPKFVRGLNADSMRTLGCVLYLLKHHTEGQPMQILLRSVYVGGDVDSLAALCLAMVGARDGLRFGENGGIPLFMLEELEAVEYLTGLAGDFGRWAESIKAANEVVVL